MANIDTAYSVEKLSLGDDDVLLVTGFVDPTTGAGYEAPVGSIFFYKNGTDSSLYIKNDVADTDWMPFLKIQEPIGAPGTFLHTINNQAEWRKINKQYISLRAMGI